jgi:hypothetical protein
MMMIKAGMFKKTAGLVPSIMALNNRALKATPIPMAVAAFIAPVHRPQSAILQWPLFVAGREAAGVRSFERSP